MPGTAPSNEAGSTTFNLRQWNWHRLYTPLALCFCLALYTTCTLGRGGGAFWSDLAFSFWSMRFILAMSLLFLIPYTAKKWLSAVLLLPIVIAYVWQVASLELYAVQMRFLSFKEVSELFIEPSTRGIVWEQLLSLRLFIFLVVIYGSYFVGDFYAQRFIRAPWSLGIVFVVVPLLMLGQLSAERKVYKDRFFYANARVCMPWSSAHQILQRVPIANLAQARAHWLQAESPFWSNEATPYFTAFGDRYHGRSVLVILLESHALMNVDRWVQDAVGARPCSPYLSELYEHGIGFEEYYATGFSTSSAAWSLLASAPHYDAAPFSAHLTQLGCIPDFQKKQYHVDWLKAASIEFAHFHELTKNLDIEAGVRAEEAAYMKEKDDAYWTAWGMPDEQLFQVSFKRIQKNIEQGKPFLHFVLTVSNHIPFKFPAKIAGEPLSRDYFGGMRYTDHALKSFIQNIKSLPQQDRPIVFITADTSYRAEGAYLLDQDSIPVEPTESIRVPALLLLPDEARPLERVQQLMNHEDVLPLLAELVGIETPFTQRYKRKRRQAVAVKDYEGFSILSPKHYLYGNQFLMQRRSYWRYDFADLHTEDGRVLQQCRTYLHTVVEQIWQQKEGEMLHRENNWGVMPSSYRLRKGPVSSKD